MKCSQDGMQFLVGLLERDVSRRLGWRPDDGLKEIRTHPWLSSFDWDKLENKQLQPPFIPDVGPPLFCLCSHHFNSFNVCVALIFNHPFIIVEEGKL